MAKTLGCGPRDEGSIPSFRPEQKLKKFLEEEREDYLKLKGKNNLTKKGEGMLLMINVIFKEMRWKIKNL